MPSKDLNKQDLNIVIYSRRGCDVCKRIKDRIIGLGFEIEEKDFDAATSFTDDWREKKAYVVLAGYMMEDHLPVIFINDEFMKINKALNFLKEFKNGDNK